MFTCKSCRNICIYQLIICILYKMSDSMSKYDVMNVIFVSSRGRGRQGQYANRIGDTVHITVPNDLILRLLPEGAILQLQIGPVPYIRQDSARPTSRADSGRSSRPASRPDSGRPTSRQPNPARDRPISPFTDWSSFGEMPAN